MPSRSRHRCRRLPRHCVECPQKQVAAPADQPVAANSATGTEATAGIAVEPRAIVERLRDSYLRRPVHRAVPDLIRLAG